MVQNLKVTNLVTAHACLFITYTESHVATCWVIVCATNFLMHHF